MKQETVWSRPKGGSSGDEIAWCGTDPICLMENWTRLIQLAIRWVGRGSSNSPNGELDWSIQLTIGWVGCGSSNSPNGDLDLSIQLAITRVGCGLSNFPDGGSDDVGLVASMLWNCLSERLNDPWGTCRAILLKIRSFSFPFYCFLFRKFSRDFFDIDFVVTDFDPNITPQLASFEFDSCMRLGRLGKLGGINGKKSEGE